MISWITNNGMTIHPKGKSIANDDLLYYILKNIEDEIKGFAEGTAQPKLSSSSVLSLEVQLPPLTEQQTLQSDFDEIRHKHAKIANYKAKTQEAIQRLIPGTTPTTAVISENIIVSLPAVETPSKPKRVFNRKVDDNTI